MALSTPKLCPLVSARAALAYEATARVVYVRLSVGSYIDNWFPQHVHPARTLPANNSNK